MIGNETPDAKKNSDDSNTKSQELSKIDAPVKSHGLPRSIRLGVDHVVNVKRVSEKRMAEVAPDSDELDGLWHGRTNAIYVLSSLPLEEQWEILRHELLHAIIDVDHEVRPNRVSSDDVVPEFS